MKNTDKHELENREIGELIAEITEKGWNGLSVDVHPDFSACVSVGNYSQGEDSPILYVEAGSLVECFRQIVDMIRRQLGQPTLAEEVNALIYQQTEHESLPPIVIGESAACRCGSDEPLTFERKITLRTCWHDRSTFISSLNPGEVDLKTGKFHFSPAPGEIASCPDCGAWYQLNP